jgi:hypothetical protein
MTDFSFEDFLRKELQPFPQYANFTNYPEDIRKVIYMCRDLSTKCAKIS